MNPKELLRNLMQEAAKMASSFSEEEMNYILGILRKIAEKIVENEQVQQQPQENLPPEQENAPIATPPTSGIANHPELPPAPHESSNVNGFRYDPKSGKLLVQFHGPYPQKAGAIYAYDKVPPYIYDIFARGGVGPKTSGANRYHRWQRGVTPSHGAALNALLKAGGFQYQRLS